jgi:hypothetical protein
VSTSATAEHQPDILRGLRSLKGRGTIGDVVSSVGLPRDQVEPALKALLESHRGHLEVTESGEMVYAFDRKLIRRDAVPLMTRFLNAAKRFIRGAFKAWIVLMLVVYFVVFVVLVIAAIVAMMSRGGERRSGGGGWGRGRGHHHGGHFQFPSFLLWYYIWTPRWRLGRSYYGRRWEAVQSKENRSPFYKKVFAFVFGPDQPKPTQQQHDRSVLRLIRARKGVLTTAELMQHNALPMPAAEEELGRLLGSYEGEPVVTDDGELVYTFPELLMSAHGPVTDREPNPAWLRLEYPLEITGNETKHNAVIVGMNGFNLLAGVTAPVFIFPQLGLGGPAAFVGLVFIPVVFSVLFFSVPLLRRFTVQRENRRREARNLRRVVLGLVYREALAGAGKVTVDRALDHARSGLKRPELGRASVEAVLQQLATEFESDISTDKDGTLIFHFDAVRRQFAASELIRHRVKLEDRTLGEVVYSTADSRLEESARDAANLERELKRSDLDFSGYLRSPDRVGFEDDYEVVAFDEELKLQAAGRR